MKCSNVTNGATKYDRVQKLTFFLDSHWTTIINSNPLKQDNTMFLFFFCTLLFKSLLTEKTSVIFFGHNLFFLWVCHLEAESSCLGIMGHPSDWSVVLKPPPREELVDMCSYCNTRHRRKKPTSGFHLPTGFTAAPSMPHQPPSAGAADLPPDSLKRRNRPVMAPPYQFALLDVAHASR